jgi:hypothetical protein
MAKKEKDEVKYSAIGRQFFLKEGETLKSALADYFKEYCVLKSFKAEEIFI